VKKERPRAFLPADTTSPEFIKLMTEGIPASIDSDPVHDHLLSKLLSSIDIEVSVRFGKRTGLYKTWLALPSVTVSQGAWLLIGRDPFEPRTSEPEPPPENLQRLHAETVNRLECEVVAGALKPSGSVVRGFERRFRLTAVAQTALRIGIAESAASHLLMIAESATISVQPNGPWQTERVEERIVVHRKLIDVIRAQSPEALTPIAPKKRSNPNRRAKVEPINVLIDMPSTTYDVAFDALYVRECGGHPAYHMSRLMLREDRDQLNVKFKRGRRRQAAAGTTRQTLNL
jgi:hypothetical protein